LTATALAVTRDRAWAASEGRGGNFIKLDQNENPYGISKKVEEAIVAAAQQSNRYPLRELAALRDLIAEREEVANNCVILGAGSTEIFSLVALAYGGKGKTSLVAEPTYGGYPGYAEGLGGEIVRVPVNDRWETDLDAMAKRVTKSTNLIYLCNPNNPTGTIANGARLREFCEEQAKERPVLVDEAYFELMDDSVRTSMVSLVRKSAPVIVARTFSKLFGLAGLRVGYGIAKPDIISDLRKFQTNFCAVNRLGIVAARAAYLDTEHIEVSRRRNGEARAGLYDVLKQLGHKAIPGSQTNFVAFEAKNGSDALVNRLRSEHNIGTRTYQFLGKSWVRISIGTREEMNALTAALKENS
jgi:histidinol-phosphate aminotransferase